MAQAAIMSEEQKTQNWQGSNLWLVGSAYFFQGFYVLGTRIYALTMMANWGVLTDTQATVLAFLGLPGYLKVFPGLLSDRIPLERWGRRKPYIFLGGLLFLPGYLLMIKIQEFGTIWIAALLLFVFAWLLADTNLDALTVDITPQERIGQMQGAVQSGRRVGAIFGALLVPLLGPRIGWSPTLVALCVGALLQSGTALMIQEIPISREVLSQKLPLKNALKTAFSHKIVWFGLFFILFFSAAQATNNLLSIYLLSELGWSDSPEKMQTFAYVEVLSSIAIALGAFWTGRLPSNKLNSFRSYVLFLIAFWVLTLPWLLVDRSPQNQVLIFSTIIFVGICRGAGKVLMMVLAMRVCPKTIEGFTFALMMSAANFGTLVVGAKTASSFVEAMGGVIPAIFILIPFGFVSLVFLYPLLQSFNQRQVNTNSQHLE